MKILMPFIVALATLTGALEINNTSSNLNFLFNLIINIDDTKIPNYVVNLIHNNKSTEKNITTSDVVNVFQLKNISLITTEDILTLLNISHSQAFSLQGFNKTLETLNLTFVNFYNEIIRKMGITPDQELFALQGLQINYANFIVALRIHPDKAWEEFSYGNFTRLNLEQACSATGATLENLWKNSTDIFVKSITHYTVQDFLKISLNSGIGHEESLIVWKRINISTENVYEIQAFSDILKNVNATVKTQPILGALIDQNNISSPRSAFNLFKNDVEVVKIQAHPVRNPELLLTIDSINETAYNNFVLYHYNNLDVNIDNVVNVIEISEKESDFINCSYITYFNGSIDVVEIPSTKLIDGATYKLNYSIVQEVVAGSALVSDNFTLIGLVKGLHDDIIVIDTFEGYKEDDDHAASNTIVLAKSILGFVALLYIILL